jgi:NDP-sugar pyrophosphorylase family protein
VAVFILAGGLGTRLRKADDRPKAIVPVAGRPFLAYTLRLLRKQGYRKIVLCLGVGADEVAATFAGEGILSSVEPEPLGTGGALAHAARHASRFNLILNGDSYAEAVYQDLLAAHVGSDVPSQRSVTLLAVRQENCADYGRLNVDEHGRVVSFVEKGEAVAGWINAGVYAAGGSWLRGLPAGRYSLERDILPGLAAEGRLRALTGRFFFRDIGTPERLRLAREEFRWIQNRMEAEG